MMWAQGQRCPWSEDRCKLRKWAIDRGSRFDSPKLRAAAPAADPGKVKKPREVHDLDSVAIGCWLLLALAASYWLCAPFACSCPRS